MTVKKRRTTMLGFVVTENNKHFSSDCRHITYAQGATSVKTQCKTIILVYYNTVQQSTAHNIQLYLSQTVNK